MGLHSLAHSPVLDALSNPLVSGVLGAFALLGPGRQLLLDGFKSLAMGNPNMNSLVAVGSSTSFSVGALSVLVPGLGFGTSFLEEPVMLLAFVLLGRALEARAKVGTAGRVHTCMCVCVRGGGSASCAVAAWGMRAQEQLLHGAQLCSCAAVQPSHVQMHRMWQSPR